MHHHKKKSKSSAQHQFALETFGIDDEDAFENSNIAEKHQEVLSLLGSFQQLLPAQQNMFLSRITQTLSLDQIHLLFRRLNGLMTVDFVSSLPEDVSCIILSLLDNRSLFNAMRVSRKWNSIVFRNDSIWKSAFLSSKTAQCECKDLLLQSALSSELPYRTLLKRHFQIQNNWINGRYKLINVVCSDVGVITTIQFDREKIILGTDDGHVLLASPKTGLIMHSFAGHTGGVWALQYVGNLLVTGSTDRTLRIWDIRGKRLLHSLIGHRSTVRCLGITADGRFIISGSRDRSVKIWSAADGVLLHSFNEHHADSVRCLAIDGSVAVTGSYDCTLRVWDVANGACMHHLTGHSDKIYSVALKDSLIVSGGHTGSVKVWDLPSGNCLFNLVGHCGLISCVLITPGYIATGSTDCSVRHWDKRNGTLQTKFSLHSASVSALAADEYRMLTGSDSSLRFWNIKNGTSKELLPEVNVIWRIEMNETMCVATGDSLIEINGNRMNTSTLHIFDFE